MKVKGLGRGTFGFRVCIRDQGIRLLQRGLHYGVRGLGLPFPAVEEFNVWIDVQLLSANSAVLVLHGIVHGLLRLRAPRQAGFAERATLTKKERRHPSPKPLRFQSADLSRSLL